MAGARRFFPVLIALACLLVAAPAAHPVDATQPVWVDFYGETSTLNGQPLPEGAVVRAYDPDGVLAGRAEVALAGWYLIAVYGDDPQTAPDEGAEAGDTITFTIQGQPAATLGPDEPVWTSSVERLHVELAANSGLVGDLDGDCDVDIDDVSLVTAAWRCRPEEGCYAAHCDLDNDGDIDVIDIMQVVAHWDESCSP
jgi:hypothetical protein